MFSFSCWHMGQLEYLRCFLFTITEPVAVSPLTHLLSKIFRFKVVSFLAFDSTSQFTNDVKTAAGKFNLFACFSINFAFIINLYIVLCEP